MHKEIVGSVTEPEKCEVQKLFERKIALSELLLTIGSSPSPNESQNALYEKIVSDTGETQLLLSEWWSKMSKKYGWKSVEGGHWNIDFNTNDIFLTCNK